MTTTDIRKKAWLEGYIQARRRYEPVITALRNWLDEPTDDAQFALRSALDKLDSGDFDG